MWDAHVDFCLDLAGVTVQELASDVVGLQVSARYVAKLHSVGLPCFPEPLLAHPH